MPVHAGASAALHRQTSLAHSDSSWGADRPGDKPVAANSVSLGPPRSQRVGASWASEVFYEHLLERRRIQHRLRQQLLQLAVLVLQRLELAGIGDLHPTVARAPLVEGRIADAVLAAQLARRQSGSVLLQHLDDLFFRKSALTHVRLPEGTDSTQKRGRLRGAGHTLWACIRSLLKPLRVTPNR